MLATRLVLPKSEYRTVPRRKLTAVQLFTFASEKVKRTVEVFICHNGDLDFWEVGGVTCG